MCGVGSTHNGLRFTYSEWNSTYSSAKTPYGVMQVKPIPFRIEHFLNLNLICLVSGF